MHHMQSINYVEAYDVYTCIKLHWIIYNYKKGISEGVFIYTLQLLQYHVYTPERYHRYVK